MCKTNWRGLIISREAEKVSIKKSSMWSKNVKLSKGRKVINMICWVHIYRFWRHGLSTLLLPHLSLTFLYHLFVGLSTYIYTICLQNNICSADLAFLANICNININIYKLYYTFIENIYIFLTDILMTLRQLPSCFYCGSEKCLASQL